MREVTFVLGPDHQPAEIWDVMGSAGIVMEASCTFPSVEGRAVRVVLRDEDVEKGKAAALAAGFGPLDETEVIIANIELKPGGLGQLARKVADAGVKVHILYMATGNRVVIGGDDLGKVADLV